MWKIQKIRIRIRTKRALGKEIKKKQRDCRNIKVHSRFDQRNLRFERKNEVRKLFNGTRIERLETDDERERK